MTARRCCSPRRLGGPGVARGQAFEHEPIGIGDDLRLAAPATQLVQEAEVRDLQDPCADRAALGIEPVRVAPDGEEDLLHEVFGGGAVERPDGQPEDQPREATVEQPERLGGALGDLAHQLLVARRRAPSMASAGFRSCERTSVGPDDASRHPLHRAGGSGLVHRPTPGSPPPSAPGVRRKSVTAPAGVVPW